MRRALILFAVVVGGFATLNSMTVISAERPNLVFIYTDDQRWDSLGVVQREQGEKGRFPWLESRQTSSHSSWGAPVA